MTFDEGRIRMAENPGFSTLPYDQNQPSPGVETMPVKPGTPSGFEFLRYFTSQKQPNWGGSPGEEIPEEVRNRLLQPGTKPPEGFFDELRRKLGSTGVKEAKSPSFDIFPPDIDSPEVDAWLKEHREKYGQQKVNPQDVQRRMENFRRSLRLSV